jgi:hypothetical protein
LKRILLLLILLLTLAVTISAVFITQRSTPMPVPAFLEQFLNDPYDCSPLGLYKDPDGLHYYCTPVDMYVFASTGADGMHFGVIPDTFGETVFAVTPDAFGEQQVYPVAKNFADFLALVCALGDSTAVEEAPRMTRERFEEWLSGALDEEWIREYRNSEAGRQNQAKSEAAAAHLRETYSLPEIADPYGYIRAISDPFDPTVLQYPDEYYE